MRHPMAKLVPAVLVPIVGGCSLIYNPSNIDKPMADARLIDMAEVSVDVEIRADAMPLDLTLSEAFPTTIYEGAGVGGGRPGIVVIRGHNLIKDPSFNLAVTLNPGTAGAATLSSFEASGNGDYLALVVTAPIVDTCHKATSVPVGVTVMQSDGAGGTVTKTLDNAFSITCLEELTAPPTTTAALEPLYSKIEYSGTTAITPGVTASYLALRSASYIAIGDINVSASGREPGPAGGRGGLAGATPAAATGPSPGVNGANGNVVNMGGVDGGAAGYATAGGNSGAAAVGDPWLASLTTNASSGGGAGGNAYLTNNGGAGGGGGGTVELTATGPITFGALTANGGNGAASTGGGGTGAGGTGGTVLIRSGGMLTFTSVSVAAGTGNANTSSIGRIRTDAASGNYPTGAKIGPMFVDLPAKTSLQTQPVNLRGTPGDSTATLRVFDTMGNVVANMTYTPVFGAAGTGGAATAQVMPVLKAGWNKICVWVMGGADTVPESVNCETIAYLPP